MPLFLVLLVEQTSEVPVRLFIPSSLHLADSSQHEQFLRVRAVVEKRNMSDPWSREHHYPTSRGRHRPADHHNSRSREVGTRTWEGSSSSSSPEPQREATSSSYWEADVDVEDAPVEDVPAVTGATVRVVCKANFDYSLTVRNNEVVLAPARASDDRQVGTTCQSKTAVASHSWPVCGLQIHE